MISFWLYAGLLCVAALAFLLAPQLRRPHERPADSRAAVNVGLYRERLRALEALHEGGTLDAAQLDVGRVEAARELLDDARDQHHPTGARRGRMVPLVAALSTPPLALALYLHWGALDQLTRTRFPAAQAAPSIENIAAHLESLLATTPDAAEGWSLLGRAYMAQNRMAEAAQAFERAATLSGRPAELLGRWAEAQYIAGGRQWTPQLQALASEALAGNPLEPTSLKLLGMARFHAGRYREAAASWERLLATLPERDPDRTAIANDISRARQLAVSAGINGTPP